jgi:hypothetical protein
MKDTIELLESIGRDASLRHASTEKLIDTLAQAQATAALTAAVASGDHSPLWEELGYQPFCTPQTTLGPAHEEDEPDYDDGGEPYSPPAPDQGKSLS